MKRSFFLIKKKESRVSLDRNIIIEPIPGAQQLQGKDPDEILDLLHQGVGTLPDKQALVHFFIRLFLEGNGLIFEIKKLEIFSLAI